MSKEALIKREGRWVPVHISEISMNEKNGEFICNGRINGSEIERCDAPMRPRNDRITGKFIDFTQAKNKAHPHCLGCEHDRRRPQKIHKELDMRCKTLEKETFLEKMLSKKDEEGREPGGHGPVGPPHHGPKEHGPDNPNIEKEIVVSKRGPKTMVEAIQTLRCLQPNNKYMDHYVKEWIIADKTIEYFLGQESLPQEYIIVLGKPVSPDKAEVKVDVRQNEWVLSDVTFQGEVRENHLFFKLHLCDEGKQFVDEYRKKRFSKEYYLGICAKWERHATDPNVLEAYNVSEKMLFLIPHEKEKLNEK